MSNVYADHISVAAASGTALGAGGGTIATVDLLISFATPDGTVTNLDLQNSLVNDVAMTEVDGTLTVSCLPPILAYNDAALRDVCIFGGIGNNDGVADPGEYLYLTVTLINNGPGDATGVSAVMSTATPGATVMMNTSTYPDIPASGGTAQSNSEYMVMVDETFTCGDVIVLDLTITATEGSWTDSFNVPTGAKKRQVILLSEEFETWPPAGWQNNNLGGDCVWDTTANTGGYLSGGNETGGTGEAADANSDDCGNGTTMDTELVTPSIDLTAATTGYLEYNCFFQDMAGLGDAWTDISTDGGTTWTNLVYETTDDASGHLVHVDLTPYVGNTILIRFRYASTGWGWNWEVDSVLVDADAGGGGGGTCNVCAGAPCTPVDQFTNVSPEDGAEGVEPPVTLVWEPAANATYYEVYVGTTPMGVAYVGTTTDTTYTLTDLEAGTTYYWIVSAFNDCSFKNGPRWNFTTSGGAAPTGATDVFVAAAAETSGSRGTHWQTDIRMLNPMDHTIAYSITFIPSDTDGMTSPYVYNGTIPTHEEMMMDNMLTNMFGVSNMAGALHVTSDDPVYVTTRTYTTSDTGSYGQFIPAVSKSMALNMPSPARAQHAKARQADSAHLVMLSSTETRRTNVGFVEVTGQAATANVTLYDDQNNYLGSGAYPLYPMGHFQVDIFNDLGITDEVPVARAEVTVTGAGAILAYASMIDQDSGDAVYIPAQIFDAEDMKKLIVPVAAKAAGANDTSWRTELRIFNPADTAQDVTVTYTTGATSLAANISLESKKVYMSENFLQQLFTLVGDTYGVLTLTSPSGVVAMSRTYTTADVGSYGQGVMPTMADESFKSGTMGYLIHLTQNEDFRSNLGFSEIGLGDAVILIELFDHDGTYLGSYGFGMGIHENRQFNEIVRIIYGDELLNNGYIRFTVVSGQGQVLPYLSVVDNLSGDAIFVTP